MLALCVALAAPGLARAISIDPAWFLGASQFGLEGAPAPQFGADDTALFLNSGAQPGNHLVISQDLQPALQNPQAAYADPLGPCQPGDVCQTEANPFVADSLWTVQNTTASVLENAFLVFSMVDLSGGYPDLPVALDQNKVKILKYTSGGSDFYFGMVALGTLGANGSADDTASFTMRYIVGADLPLEDPGANTSVDALQIMPPIGTFGIVGVTPIPEPGTALLLAVGLAGLAVTKRKRG